MLLKRKESLKWSRVGSEYVVLDTYRGECLRLNDLAGFIWEQLDGRCNEEEIAAQIEQTYDADSSQIRKDIKDCLNYLIELEIVEIAT